MKKNWRIYIAPTLVLLPLIPLMLGWYDLEAAFIFFALTSSFAWMYLIFFIPE